MKVQRLVFALAVLFTLGLSTSCEKSDIAQEEADINAIDGNEIKEQDM